MTELTRSVGAALDAYAEKMWRTGLYTFESPHPMVNEWSLRQMWRAQFKEWKRPFIAVEVTVTTSGDSAYFSATVTIPRRVYLRPVVAMLLLGGYDATYDLRRMTRMEKPLWFTGRSVWRFNFRGEEGARLFDTWMQQVTTDPEIRRAMRVPDAADPLPPKVTALQTFTSTTPSEKWSFTRAGV